MKNKLHNKFNSFNNPRYSFAPQMKIYDEMKTDYEPYFMFINKKNFRSSVCNTDKNGFRFSNNINKENDIFQLKEKKETFFLLGASTAFGVGTTNDKFTLSSLLCNNDVNCFNISGRAYSGFQEILSLLFSLNSIKPNKIIILSGINDIFLNLKHKNLNKDAFGSFFFSSKYESIFSNNKKKIKLGNLFSLFNFKDQSNLKDFDSNYFEKNKKNLIEIIEKNIEILSIISKGINAEMTFCLQPFFNWIKKKPSDEELEIVKYLDIKSPENNILYNMISENYEFIRDIYKNSCDKNKINFLDINEKINKLPLGEVSVFVDRVHLNDFGTKTTFNILKESML